MDRKLNEANTNNSNINTAQPSNAVNTSITGNNASLIDNLNQLDNLSNLIINNTNHQQYYQRQQQQQQQQYTSYLTAEDHDNALLDKYEYDMSKLIQEKYLVDKEQANQKLFQSFQTSACAVAQMFKDKTNPNPVVSQTSSAATVVGEADASAADESNKQQPPKTQSPQLTQWQSFQNSAGAITVLYKGNKESIL